MLRKLILGTVLAVSVGTGLAQAHPPGMPSPYNHNPFPQESYYERLANQWVRLYLNRAATPREVMLITAQLRNGKTHEEVQANIMASDEYYRKGNYNVSNFIRQVFVDVLGRNASPAEVGMLVGQAVAKGRYRFALEFLVANRGINRGAPVRPIIVYNFPFLPF